MNDQTEPDQFVKSPLILLFLVGVLVISTLVFVSEYFLRPQIEAELKKETTQSFTLLNAPRNKIELFREDKAQNNSVVQKHIIRNETKVDKDVLVDK